MDAQEQMRAMKSCCMRGLLELGRTMRGAHWLYSIDELLIGQGIKVVTRDEKVRHIFRITIEEQVTPVPVSGEWYWISAPSYDSEEPVMIAQNYGDYWHVDGNETVEHYHDVKVLAHIPRPPVSP